MSDGSSNKMNSDNRSNSTKALSFLASNGKSIRLVDDDAFITEEFIPTSAQKDKTSQKFQSTSSILKSKFGIDFDPNSKRNKNTYKYFESMERLPPNDLLQSFAEKAPPNVQEAAKSTIVNIMGSLPSFALDAALLTTSSKLANLMYQMQLTGYMFKNAEYRMSISNALKGLPRYASRVSIAKNNITIIPSQLDTSMVTGKVNITLLGGDTLRLSAEELTEALTCEVSALRAELQLLRSEREKELRSNLLTYVQALPERDLTKLTSGISEEVMQTIQLLVAALMERMGVDLTGPEVVVQQSLNALMQLCMWQLVVGYRLREMEAFDKGNFLGD